MTQKFELFSDPMYSADMEVLIDLREVEFYQEKMQTLFMRGQFPVTVVKMKGGSEYVLAGRQSEILRLGLERVRK